MDDNHRKVSTLRPTRSPSSGHCRFVPMQTTSLRIVFTAYHFPEALSVAWATVPYDSLPRIVHRSNRLSTSDTSRSMLICRKTQWRQLIK